MIKICENSCDLWHKRDAVLCRFTHSQNRFNLFFKNYRLIGAIILLNLFFELPGKSQNIGIGADAIYNFQTTSLGAGARVNFFPNENLSFVPQFSYYFPFNKINEYNLGLGLEYKFMRSDNFNLYAILHGAYNSWLNYEASPLAGAQANNWNLEGGLGITNNWCLRPFLEYRYNLKFRETQLHLGLLYVIGCKSGGRKNYRCPAYGRKNTRYSVNN